MCTLETVRDLTLPWRNGSEPGKVAVKASDNGSMQLAIAARAAIVRFIGSEDAIRVPL